jgi:carbon monoxide dehydrogenase subunit G
MTRRRSVVQLQNSFTVPVPVDDAWRVLLDIERIAPCMPGAALDSVEGDDFTGRVKVKLGPINLTYQGKASFVEKDEAARRAVIDAKGKDQRGNGTAAAVVTATLTSEGAATRVDVVTDLNITGRPAQFGRGVMTDVGNKLLGQFADKLAAQLAASSDFPADADVAAVQQEPTVTGTAAGAVEEIAASAEQVPGDNAAAEAVRTTGAATKKTAAAASDSVTTTQEIPKKAPAKKAAAKKTAEPAVDTTQPVDITKPVAGVSAPAAATAEATAVPPVPSRPPAGTTAPPSRPATGAPARGTPSAGVSRPQPVAEPEPIDLLEVAGGAALTRLAVPAAGVFGLLVLIALVLRRLRRD